MFGLSSVPIRKDFPSTFPSFVNALSSARTYGHLNTQRGQIDNERGSPHSKWNMINDIHSSAYFSSRTNGQQINLNALNKLFLVAFHLNLVTICSSCDVINSLRKSHSQIEWNPPSEDSSPHLPPKSQTLHLVGLCVWFHSIWFDIVRFVWLKVCQSIGRKENLSIKKKKKIAGQIFNCSPKMPTGAQSRVEKFKNRYKS